MIDDQLDVLDAYKTGLGENFSIHPFLRPGAALQFINKNPVDAVVIDYHLMPGDCAWETFEELRRKDFQNPVMLLTGESRTDIKLEGLERGIDDYLQKPISMSELSAYLNNRIRNSRKRNPQIIKVKNLELNLRDPQIMIDGTANMLTHKEFEILKLLVTNQNSVVTKNRILEKIWADVSVEKNNIDTHMSNLRKKLKGFECQIKTIKKIGYVLRVR